jgi:hypothetical protein
VDLFVSPSSRQLFVDWEQVTRHSVMSFRTAYDQYIGDAWFERFLTDIQAQSPEFRALWSRHDVQGVCDFYQQKELNHPQVGPLSLSSTVLIVPVDPPLHMVTFTPGTQETRSKLETLNAMERLQLGWDKPQYRSNKCNGGLRLAHTNEPCRPQGKTNCTL